MNNNFKDLESPKHSALEQVIEPLSGYYDKILQNQRPLCNKYHSDSGYG